MVSSRNQSLPGGPGAGLKGLGPSIDQRGRLGRVPLNEESRLGAVGLRGLVVDLGDLLLEDAGLVLHLTRSRVQRGGGASNKDGGECKDGDKLHILFHIAE